MPIMILIFISSVPSKFHIVYDRISIFNMYSVNCSCAWKAV